MDPRLESEEGMEEVVGIIVFTYGLGTPSVFTKQGVRDRKSDDEFVNIWHDIGVLEGSLL